MPGTVRKISVAVIVDGRYEMKPGSDGAAKQTYVARPPEEMKSIEELVKKAVGYNETRGDQITVSNIPFVSDAAGSEMVQSENKWLQLLRTYQKLMINVVLVLIVLFFVIRPFMRKIHQVVDDIGKLPEPPPPPPTLDEQITALLLDPGREISVRRQSTALVKYNPDRATEIIRSWLRDEV
jgi:flagellar M-ring protein FliF